MNIVVILRSVPDTAEDLPLVHGQLDWDDAVLKLNEFDDYALEEAIVFKEEFGANVIVLALEAEGARMLQTAVARGADRAVQISVDVPSGKTGRSTAPVYAAAINTLDADLVMTGLQTPGDMFGQLAPFLAAELSWPHLGGVIGVEKEQNGVVVTQEYGGGRGARLQIHGPAVIGVQASRRPPKYVSGSKLRQAIKEVSVEALDTSASLVKEPVYLIGLKPPAKARNVTFFDDDPENAATQIIDLLSERGVLGGADA